MKNDFFKISRRDLGEFFGEIALRPVRVQRRCVCDRIDLIDPRLVHARLGMPDAHRQHAAEAVEIFVALVVPDIFAFTFNERERLLVVGGNGREKKFFVLADGFGER